MPFYIHLCSSLKVKELVCVLRYIIKTLFLMDFSCKFVHLIYLFLWQGKDNHVYHQGGLEEVVVDYQHPQSPYNNQTLPGNTAAAVPVNVAHFWTLIIIICIVNLHVFSI